MRRIVTLITAALVLAFVAAAANAWNRADLGAGNAGWNSVEISAGTTWTRSGTL